MGDWNLEMDRRSFLCRSCTLVGGAVVLGPSLGCGGEEVAGPTLPPIRNYLVPPDNTGVVDKQGLVGISRVGNRVFAHSTICTHERCFIQISTRRDPPYYECPCHTAWFKLDGSLERAPATRSLNRHAVRLLEDGMVEVDTTVLLREGQPGYETAFVDLADGPAATGMG